MTLLILQSKDKLLELGLDFCVVCRPSANPAELS